MPLRRQETGLRARFLCPVEPRDVFVLIVLWGPELELLVLDHLPIGFDVQAPLVPVQQPLDHPAQQR